MRDAVMAAERSFKIAPTQYHATGYSLQSSIKEKSTRFELYFSL